MSFETIAPAQPVAAWQGGKRTLFRTIIERIEQIPHKTYCEPFVGMGGIFLRRSLRPTSEVINDHNGEIINLFRILQRHFPQFIDYLRFQVSSRKEFERLRSLDPSKLTDLERAGRFLYLQRLAFGGQLHGVFGVSPTTSARFDLTKIVPLLEDVHERLSGVMLECLGWSEFIKRYDSSETLFYLDPPYWGCEDDYGKNIFSRWDFQKIADQMTSIKGAFLLSINDVPEIREIFSNFAIDEVRLKYSIAKTNSGKISGELIIGNRKVSAGLF